MKFLMWILFFLAFSCDGPEGTNQDAGKDAGKDAGDDIDVIDIVDVSDITDAVDADGDVDPGHDPHQIAVSSMARAYGAYYPYIFYIELWDSSHNRVYVINIETKQIELAQNIPYLSASIMVPAPWENSVYYSAYSYPVGGFPSETPIDNYLFKLNIETLGITDVTSLFTNVRSPECELNNGVAKIQSIDPERGWYLFDCHYVVNSTSYKELYRININTQELQYVTDGVEVYFHTHGYTRPWHINRNYIVSTFSDRYENVYSGYKRHMVYDLSGDTPSVIWDGRSLAEANGSAGQVSSDNYFCEVRLGDNTYDVVCENLISGDIITAPQWFAQKDSTKPVSTELPHLIGWTEGSGSVGEHNGWLQSVFLKDLYLWDKSSDVIRQVTWDRTAGYYGIPAMIPGDPEYRWILYCGPSSDYGIQLYVKDLRASGIINAQGHLIPEK
ncbi:hypothetical protein KKF34_03550 [Myxococcota bacterium]|nr:hypothetical protein [Myxococcota bacterium]MBU1380898.1 hypothetical protein [Myxococcota bacterium]MBU1495932.1 hypothetical protein [Myxococcota bacterium]